MSETTQTSTAVAGEHNEQGQEEGKEFTAITSQADFDTAIQARIARERAKIPTDYDELKANAAKFTEWQESQKTEAQKQTDRTAELERENAALKSESLRATVAATKGVPAALLSGSTQAELEAAADALIQFKGAPAPRLHVPNEGKSPSVQPSNESEFVGALFSSGD